MKQTTRSMMAQTQWKVTSHHVTAWRAGPSGGSRWGYSAVFSRWPPRLSRPVSVLRGGWGRAWSFPWARPKNLCSHPVN